MFLRFLGVIGAIELLFGSIPIFLFYLSPNYGMNQLTYTTDVVEIGFGFLILAMVFGAKSICLAINPITKNASTNDVPSENKEWRGIFGASV